MAYGNRYGRNAVAARRGGGEVLQVRAAGNQVGSADGNHTELLRTGGRAHGRVPRERQGSRLVREVEAYGVARCAVLALTVTGILPTLMCALIFHLLGWS